MSLHAFRSFPRRNDSTLRRASPAWTQRLQGRAICFAQMRRLPDRQQQFLDLAANRAPDNEIADRRRRATGLSSSATRRPDVLSASGMHVRPSLVEFPGMIPSGRAASGRVCSAYGSRSAPRRRRRRRRRGQRLADPRPRSPGRRASARTRTGKHTVSLPYFAVDDVDAALQRVKELGGSVIHSAIPIARPRGPERGSDRRPQGRSPRRLSRKGAE